MERGGEGGGAGNFLNEGAMGSSSKPRTAFHFAVEPFLNIVNLLTADASN